MFYRYIKGNLRIPMDLDNSYSGSCFIAGGSPCLLSEKLSLLAQPGISTITINNTSSIVPATMAVFGDKPICYSNRILLDPRIMKFAIISRKDEEVNGDVMWKYCPNTYFIGTSDKFTVGDLLKPHRDFCWWKNTFYIALQLAYRLGFRKIYLIGCQFKINLEKSYAYAMSLTQEQVDYNNRTYKACVANLKFLKKHFEDSGLELISATPDSPLNDIYRHMTFEEAVSDSLKDFPKEYNTASCVHSSTLKCEK